MHPTDVEEETEGEPTAVAELNARRKATAVAAPLVLGADTVVSAGDALLGKPADEAQAREHLRRLGGRTHEVVGGVALAREGTVVAAAVERTRVTFRALTAELLDWYLATGEWRGRAGGYAIQGAGAALVTRVEGDYLNVVGLPLTLLLQLCPALLPGL